MRGASSGNAGAASPRRAAVQRLRLSECCRRGSVAASHNPTPQSWKVSLTDAAAVAIIVEALATNIDA